MNFNIKVKSFSFPFIVIFFTLNIAVKITIKKKKLNNKYLPFYYIKLKSYKMNTSALNSPNIQSPSSLRNGNRLKAPSKVLKKTVIKPSNNSTPNHVITPQYDENITNLRNESIKLKRRMKLQKIQREMNTQGLSLSIFFFILI